MKKGHRATRITTIEQVRDSKGRITKASKQIANKPSRRVKQEVNELQEGYSKLWIVAAILLAIVILILTVK